MKRLMITMMGAAALLLSTSLHARVPASNMNWSDWQDNVRTSETGGTGGDTYRGPRVGPVAGKFSYEGDSSDINRFTIDVGKAMATASACDLLPKSIRGVCNSPEFKAYTG